MVEITMKKTYRMQRGIISFALIIIFLIIWGFMHFIYPMIVKKISIYEFPAIDSKLFLLPIGMIILGLLLSWSIRNKLWKGIPFAFNYYRMTRRLRRHIKDARFEDEREFDNRLVKLPKIKIIFDCNRSRISGKVFIENSIKFDHKLEKMRIDSALRGYVGERNYLSDDRDWYVFEFYAVDSHKQIEFKTKDDYLSWTNITASDYSLRLDERATVPFHHLGLAGQTGSGKSFFIQMLVDQVISKKVKHELFIIDPKRTDVYQMSMRFIGSDRTADKTTAIELIKNFHERMLMRQDELQEFFKKNSNKTYRDAHLPALILLIDEFGALRESWKILPKKERDEVDSILADIAFMGRQIGCILWTATQQMNAQTMPTAVRDQLVLKVVLGDSDEQTYRTLFASSVDIPPIRFSAGLGLYSYPELASVDKPKMLAVPYCSYLE